MIEKNISFDEFEKAVMYKMFEEKNRINEILLQQYEMSSVFKREFSGAHFFTYFLIPEDAPRVMEFVEHGYGDVIVRINGSDFDFGFVLFIEDGLISYLEGYGAGSWPEAIQSYELHTFDYKI